MYYSGLLLQYWVLLLLLILMPQCGLPVARGPVVGILSGGRGILLVVLDPALDTRGARTLGSTRGLDDVTLAEIGRLIR